METTIYPDRVNEMSDGMIIHHASHHRMPHRKQNSQMERNIEEEAQKVSENRTHVRQRAT